MCLFSLWDIHDLIFQLLNKPYSSSLLQNEKLYESNIIDKLKGRRFNSFLGTEKAIGYLILAGQLQWAKIIENKREQERKANAST